MMLIYLADLVHNYKSGTHNVPLNVSLLAAYTRKLYGERVEIELFKYPDRLLDALDRRPPALLGLSNYCWNYNLNAFVGGYAKKVMPELPIVMGGPNIRIDEPGIAGFLQDNPHVDCYCMFQGEEPFAALVGALLDTPEPRRSGEALRGRDIACVYSLEGGKLRGSLELVEAKTLDYIPSPYLEGWLEPFLDDELMPLFETNRGCPYSCSYCCWGVAAQQKLKFFSLERVKAEMQHVARRGVFAPSWKIADANFGVVPRDLEIAHYLREIYESHKPFDRLVLYWDKSAKDYMVEIADALRGLGKAYIAFQTFDPEVCKHINRRNISMERLQAMSQKLAQRSGRFHTDILLGLPGETMRSHLDSLNRAVELGFDSIGGGEVRLIKGADLESEASRETYGLRTKVRLSEDSFGIYRGQLVYELEESPRETKWISEPELIRLRVIRAFFYLSFTLGEFLPLLKYVARRQVPIMDLFDALMQDTQGHPRVQALVDWVQERAENEWFDSPQAVERHLCDQAKREDFLRQPVVNINFDTYSKLLLSLETYREFRELLARVSLAACPGGDAAAIEELAWLCERRNYFLQCRLGKPETTTTVALSPDTLAALEDMALLAQGSAPEPGQGGLGLWMDQDAARLVRDCAEDPEGPGVARVSALAHMMSLHMRFVE
jgi:putative methyltransferase